MPAFLLPDLGEGLTEAEIVTWHVQVGDTVTVDQSVVEVETAKAVVEVPVPFAGRVTELHGKPGDVVAVGEPLVTVDAAGRFAEPGIVSSPAGPDDAGESGNVLIGYGTSRGRRRRRRAAPSPAVTPSPSPAAVSTAAARGTTGSTAASPASNGRVAVASPLIRQLARDTGVDITTIHGSGRGGLITRQDVDAAIHARLAEQAPGPEPVPGVAVAAGSAGVTRIPIRGLRKSVADKLSRSRREIPEATVWVDVDATEMLGLRATLNAGQSAPKISLLALLSRSPCAAIRNSTPESRAMRS
jgi:2-oxoisovalerate dehydrogenase E2 component (dihydrolipoyl transacylase)